MDIQAPHYLLMVRPAHFGSNPETLESNAFQCALDLPVEKVKSLALQEFDDMVACLENNDIPVMVIQDTDYPVKPDAVFPNNWLSMHPDGKIVTYPMLSPNRRLERRAEVVEKLKQTFAFTEVLDFSPYEDKHEIVEGTGSIIFDHNNKIGYAAISPRTNESMVRKVCSVIDYTPIIFKAVDGMGTPIYHTNVMMAIGSEFAIVCLDAIQKVEEQESILGSFSATGHKVIAISFDQMKCFAGNVIEVKRRNGERVVIISETAVQSLLPGQLDAITKLVDIVSISIPTIEKYSGGSVRCMIAGIHLPHKKV